MKNYNNVNRVEVIDSDGRQYVNIHVSELRSIFQDDGKTFKIFINNAMGEKSEQGIMKDEYDPTPKTKAKEALEKVTTALEELSYVEPNIRTELSGVEADDAGGSIAYALGKKVGNNVETIRKELLDAIENLKEI